MGPNATAPAASAVASANAALNEDRLVQLITEQVMKQLASAK
jgi:hypothetical protein